MSKPKTKEPKSKADTVTFETVRELALALPGVQERTSYGTTAFKVNGKLLARFHQGRESLVVKVEYAAREVLMGANPKAFYVTDHYRCWPWVFVRLSNVDKGLLQCLIEDAWRSLASKRAIAAFEAGRG
jgi:hypothetical protein